MTSSVYHWEDIHCYFSQEVVEQSAFETDMKKNVGSPSPKKLEKLKDSMNRAISGVHRITDKIF